MQPDERGLSTALGLLQEMEDRVTRSSALHAEWIAALAGYPAVADGRAVLRFREWFLLERTSAALGAVPIQAWAPPSPPPDSAWERLLDNFLGIFRLAARQADGSLLLEDLWSGRALVWRAAGVGETAEDRVFVGRFVLDEAGEHSPLPGLLSFTAPGLLAAIEGDLGGLRAQCPRHRLSQLECERLFARLSAGSAPATAREARPAVQELARQRAAVAELLRDAPAWTLERVGATASAAGLGELLDQLAFETGVDLELARRLIPAWLELEEEIHAAASAAPAAATEAPFDRERAAALARFDQARRDGVDLETAFQQLEADLGLPPAAAAEPAAEAEAEAEAVGPPEPPTLAALVEAFCWERNAGGAPLEARERASLAALGDWTRGLPRDPAAPALPPGALLAFLLASETLAAFEDRCAGILPFLAWLEHEQDEPLGDLLAGLRGDLAARLRRCVALNRRLARAGGRARSTARVAALAPLRVVAAAGEHALALGLLEAEQDLPRPGDLLFGVWREGRFDVGGLVPWEAEQAPPGGPAGDQVEASAAPTPARAGGANAGPGTAK